MCCLDPLCWLFATLGPHRNPCRLKWVHGSLCVWTEGDSPESRIQAVHCLVHKLPERNRQVLGLLMKHLAKWVVIVHPISTSSLSVLSFCSSCLSPRSHSTCFFSPSPSLPLSSLPLPCCHSISSLSTQWLLAGKADFSFAFSWVIFTFMQSCLGKITVPGSYM